MEIYVWQCLGIPIDGYRWPSMAIYAIDGHTCRFFLYVRKIARESGRPGFHVFCLFTPLFWHPRLPRVSHGEDLDEINRLI